MRTVLNPDKDTDKIEEFRNAPVEKQRFLVHSGRIATTSQVVKYEDDDKLCYFLETLRPRMGIKGFVQKDASHGFTFDKKKKKLKVWYGASLLKMPDTLKRTIFKDLKMEWVTAMNYKLQGLMTRALMEKIVKGKITNPRDFVKSYMKTSLRIKGISPELYYKLFKDDENVESNRGMRRAPYGEVNLFRREFTPGALNEILRCSSNPEWVVKNLYTAEIFSQEMYKDIVKECKMLGLMFDWSWSKTRIDEEHKKMSRQIREMELEYIANNSVGYWDIPELPEGWEIINNQKRLFVEGSEQDHCVYNYWDQIERKTYFVLSVKDGENRITAGISKQSHYWHADAIVEVQVDAQGRQVSPKPQWAINQIYGKRNTPCPEDIKKKVEEWLRKEETQKFFTSQTERKPGVYTEADLKMMREPGWVV